MIKNILMLSLASMLMFACKKDPAKDVVKAQVEEVKAEIKPEIPTPAVSAESLMLNEQNTKLEFLGSKVTGSHKGGFKVVSGKVDFDSSTATLKNIEAQIDMASAFTDDPKLTTHLLSPDFFDASKFAKANFKSLNISKNEKGETIVNGELNLHGVTKAISFPATISIDASKKMSIKSTFALNRKDFGIVYPGKPDDLIRENVVITISVN